MRQIFKPGDKKLHSFYVTPADLAIFNEEMVHELCATFVLAREIEWATRLFVLDMKEADEEGIGTRLEIVHMRPALLGDFVEIEAVYQSFVGNELLCAYNAHVGTRIVAKGITGQKILKKTRLARLANRDPNK